MEALRMNYYKRHLGDYAKKCGHLSLSEHGAYCLILDAYYDREQGPTRAEALRFARAHSADEIAAVDSVLGEFFTLADDRYTQNRVEEELAAFRQRRDMNRLLGAKGGEAKAKRSSSDSLSKTLSDPLANDKPSHKPLAISQKDQEPPIVPHAGDASASASDHAAILDSYHATLPACQRIEVLNPKRKRRLAAAIKLAKQVCASQGWEYVPDQFWPAYWTQCAADKWMRGEVPNPNNPAWKQNLDVLLAEDRFAGVMDKAIAAMRGDA